MGSRHSGKAMIGRALCVAPLAGLLVALPMAVQTQERGPVGPRLTFGIQQRLDSNDNLDLDPVSRGHSTHADTRLSLGFYSETPGQSFSFLTSGVLRASSGPGFGAEGSGFITPSARVSYGRIGPGSSFDLSAHVTETEIDFVRSLADLDDGSGVIVLPGDLADLRGTGTRRSIGASAALRWGQDGPLGFGIDAGVSDISYHDASSTSLHDHRRVWVGASTRMVLAPAVRAEFGLRQSHYTSSNPLTDNRDTFGATASLVRDLPDGSVSGQATFDRTEDGNRLGLSVGRSLELPRATLSASIGATRLATGRTGLTGAANFTYEALPRSRITGSLERMAIADSDDNEQLLTALSLGLTQDLTERSSLSLDLFYTRRDQGVARDVDTGSIGAAYRLNVTEDWDLNLGYRHRMRKESGVRDAHSNAVFLTLGRSFDFFP